MNTQSSIRPMSRRHVMCLAASTMLLFSACAASSTALRPTTDKPLTNADLVLGFTNADNRDNGSFSEQVTLNGVFGDGGEIYVSLLITNIAGANGTAKLNTFIKMPDGSSHSANVRLKKDKWRYGNAELEAILGESLVRAKSGELVVKLATSKLTLDLQLNSPHAPLRPAGGTADFMGGKYYATTILCPRGRLSATLTVGDADPIRIEGRALAVHRAGNVAPYAMAKSWINARNNQGDDGTFILSIFERSAQFGGKHQGWALFATDDELVLYAPTLQTKVSQGAQDGESGYTVPRQVNIQDGTIQGVIKALKLSSKKDDLKSLSSLERAMVKMLMKPWTFNHDAKFLLKSTTRRVSGDAHYSYQQLK